MVTSNGLLGEIFIDFTAGSESSGLAPDGAHFLGYKPPGLEQAVPLVLERLDPVLKGVGETLVSLQKTSDNLADLTAQQGEVAKTLQEFRKVGTHLDDLSAPTGPLHESLSNIASLTGPEGKIQKALGNVEQLTAADGGLAKTIANAQKLTSDDNIKLTLENTRKATGELNNTLTELRLKFGTITENLSEATDTLKHQPWRLIWPSTKKYPEDATAAAHQASQSAVSAQKSAQTAKKAATKAERTTRRASVD
jgi:ABC-type transporter Mla subunit MlaD